MLKIAVIIPIFNEAENLPELHRRLVAALAQCATASAEILYVNDGSTDISLELMLAQQREDPRITIIDLSRNFGHQAAIMAGLEGADADAVIIMDGDLQDPPELIPEMIAAWRGGAEIVQAERRSRQERGLRGAGLRAFHPMMRWMSDFPIPGNVGVFGLLGRRAVDEIKQLPEKNRFLPGLRAWIGFDQRTVYFDRPARAGGAPKQSLRRLLRYALDGIFSFSYKPLRLMIAVGIVISGFGFVLASAFIIKRLLGIETAQTGFTTLITMVLFLGGVQLIATGLLGEYLGRIYDEVKGRPLYIVKKRVEGGTASTVSWRASAERRPPR